jgi:hypothetical protein
MGRGRRGLSHGGVNHGDESQVGSSREDDVMSHGGSSRERHVTVGPVGGSRQWVQSQEAGQEEHQEHSHCIAAMKIGSFHFANSGRTSWSGPVLWPVF